MKVALINNIFSFHGGTERHIVDAAQILETAGVTTLFIGKDKEPNCPVESHAFPELFSLKLFRRSQVKPALIRLEAFLRNESIDLVHLVHMHHPDVTTFLAERWPTVRTVHTPYLFCVAGSRYLPHTQRVCPDVCSLKCLATHMVEGCIRYERDKPYPLTHQVKKLWEIQANHLADETLQRVGVASHFMKDLLIQHRYPEDRIDVIPPPLSEALSAIVPKPFPIDQTPTIMFVGRLIPEKGVFDVMKALMMMKTRARLIIIGDGADRAHLEKDALTLGISDQVEFRGAMPPEDTRQAYQETWLTVFPSHWPEPFGFTGIESFLNHRPTVAYNVGGVSEWLVDGKNGMLVKPQDTAGLAHAMDTLLQDPLRCQEMGAWGDHYVRERFDWRIHLDLKLKFYQRAMDSFQLEKVNPVTAGASR
jgi:glycosyltransferase involved in cell wall biosynthesis